MRIPVVLVFGALFGFHTAAAAQETVSDLSQPQAECLCVLPTEAEARVATVQDAQGQVLLSSTLGYVPIQSDAELFVGDRVVLLRDGRAVLSGPTCRVALVPDSTISLIPTDAGVCVAHASTARETAVVPALVGAGLVGGGIAAIILLDDDDRPRPVSP